MNDKKSKFKQTYCSNEVTIIQSTEIKLTRNLRQSPTWVRPAP